MTSRTLIIPVIALGALIVTLATLSFCGDNCGLIGNYLLLQHYLFHSQALTLSYSAVGLVGMTSLFLPYLSARGEQQTFNDDNEAFALLFKILKDDERRVLAAVTDAGGYSTQREISRKTNLSRLKTHRVVMRLRERGLVNAERQGRVSQVSLPPWLQRQIKEN